MKALRAYYLDGKVAELKCDKKGRIHIDEIFKYAERWQTSKDGTIILYNKTDVKHLAVNGLLCPHKEREYILSKFKQLLN